MTVDKPEKFSADWDWTVFFDNVVDPAIRETLEKALAVLGPGAGRQAVDLGCGAGNDTVYLLKAGFKVLAIDQSAEGLKRLRSRENLPHPENLETRQSRFQDLGALPACDFINASFALPFCPPDHLPDLWQNIFDALKSGGIFAGHFFGINDSWNNKVADMSFQTRAEVDDMVKGFGQVLYFNEEEYDGQDANGRAKHWHGFSLALQK